MMNFNPGNYRTKAPMMKKTEHKNIVHFLSHSTINMILYVVLIALIVFLIKYL